MTDTRSATQFVQEAFGRANEMQSAGPSNVIIWGGKFPEPPSTEVADTPVVTDVIRAFIDKWVSVLDRLPYRMYEYVQRFEVWDASQTPPALPAPIGQLERARFFGAAGDLDLRRDGMMCYWRFIGDPDQLWPALAPEFVVHDFWVEQVATPNLRSAEVKYYQWRRKDERVGAVWLDEAGLQAEGEYLLQRQYWQNGRVQFVRYIGFSSKEDGHDQ